MKPVPASMQCKKFQRISGDETLPPDLRGGVVAIGNFDGVHRGHQFVLDCALRIARQQEVPALVLTFEPHPRAYFRPDIPLPRLTPAPMKARLLEAMGFDSVIEQDFTADFAGRTADDFVHSILKERLGISHVVAGFDFHFGRNRQGDPRYLLESGSREGFGVTRLEACRDEGGEIISSTRIRELLAAGATNDANRLLGYRYTIAGTVEKGRQLGQKLGFPTANFSLEEESALRHGIYAVRYRRADGELFDGVASFGRRPTVEEEGEPLLETYLFDFSGNLYGEEGTVSFFGFLREELKFSDLEALTSQMKRDEKDARELLSQAVPISELDRMIAFSALS